MNNKKQSIDLEKIVQHIEKIDLYIKEQQDLTYAMPSPLSSIGIGNKNILHSKDRSTHVNISPNNFTDHKQLQPHVKKASKYLTASAEKMKQINANNGLITNFERKIKSVKIDTGNKMKDEHIKNELTHHANALNRLINHGRMDAEQYVNALRKITTKMHEKYGDVTDWSSIIQSSFPLPKSYTSKLKAEGQSNPQEQNTQLQEPKSGLQQEPKQTKPTKTSQAPTGIPTPAGLNTGKSVTTMPTSALSSSSPNVPTVPNTNVKPYGLQ